MLFINTSELASPHNSDRSLKRGCGLHSYSTQLAVVDQQPVCIRGRDCPVQTGCQGQASSRYICISLHLLSPISTAMCSSVQQCAVCSSDHQKCSAVCWAALLYCYCRANLSGLHGGSERATRAQQPRRGRTGGATDHAVNSTSYCDALHFCSIEIIQPPAYCLHARW